MLSLMLRGAGAGIGGVRALTLMQKHGTLEKVLASLDSSKYDIPDPFPIDEARRMFKGAPVRLLGLSVLCEAKRHRF